VSLLILNLIALLLVSLIFIGSTLVFTYLEDLLQELGVVFPSAFTFILLAEVLLIFYLLIRFKAYLAGALVLFFPLLAVSGIKTLSLATKDLRESEEG